MIRCDEECRIMPPDGAGDPGTTAEKRRHKALLDACLCSITHFYETVAYGGAQTWREPDDLVKKVLNHFTNLITNVP